MQVIRCDRCAARLEPDQETCPRCGTANSNYSAGRGKEKAKGRDKPAPQPAVPALAPGPRAPMDIDLELDAPPAKRPAARSQAPRPAVVVGTSSATSTAKPEAPKLSLLPIPRIEPDAPATRARRGPSRVAAGVGIAALILVVASAAALRFIPLEALRGLPAAPTLTKLRARVFGEHAFATDSLKAYLAAWRGADISAMAHYRVPGSSQLTNDRLYASFPLTLYGYTVNRVSVTGDSGQALVTLVVPNMTGVIRTIATMQNADAAMFHHAVVAALQGAPRETTWTTVKLLRHGREWQVLEGLDPSADELISPVRGVLGTGAALPAVPDNWDSVVTTHGLSCLRDKLGAVTLAGTVANQSAKAVGPLEIIGTFYTSQGVQVGQSVERLAGLGARRSAHFACVLAETGAMQVERYTVVVRSII